MIKEVVLKRITQNDDGTFGVLIKDDIPLCVTLEDKWIYNARGISCIPVGRYKCEKYNGTKFKDVWILRNVPDRDYILIHTGNLDTDVSGCIIVGREYGKLNGKCGILRSREAFNMLKNVLPDEFYLTIRKC